VSKKTGKRIKEKIILGIDPGTKCHGVCIILTKGKKYKLFAKYGVIHLKEVTKNSRIETPKDF